MTSIARHPSIRRSFVRLRAQSVERLRLASPALWHWVGAVTAGLALSWMFGRALSAVPPELWIHRDDGVITMSHARNLVDFGFVGVNPSGERVEGFSAPLQFGLFVLSYALTHVGYERFAAVQTLLGSVALGVALFWIVLLLGRRPWLAWLGTLVAGWLLQRSATFLLWHGSGMENALTHASYAATWAVLLLQLERPQLALGWALVPVLASLSRFESILHIGPMLVLFAVVHFRAHQTFAGARWVGACFAAWALWFGLRAAYFGHWLPNTALAQDIALSTRLEWLLLGRVPAASLDLTWSVFRSNLGVLAVLSLPLLCVVPAQRNTRFAAGLATLAVASAVLNVLLFDGARLDPPRTTTFLAPLAAAALVGLAASLRHWVAALAVLGASTATPIRSFLRVSPYELCCAASKVEDTRAFLDQFREQQQLPRPLVATPDLGALSFAKEFNVLDLGYLGSTVLARLSDAPSTNDYVYRVTAPDLIELHESWLELHASLLADPRLAALYQPWAPRGATEGRQFWLRKAVAFGARSRERELLEALAARRDPALVVSAVEQCNGESEPDACLYVMRSVYRLLPDLDSAQAEQARAALRSIADPAQRELALALTDPSTRDLTGAVRRYLGGPGSEPPAISWPSRDVARGRPFRASSADTEHSAQGTVAMLNPGRQLVHTREEHSPWLQIDLGSVRDVSSVEVRNRSDCCGELALPLLLEARAGEGEPWSLRARRDRPFLDWTADIPGTRARYLRLIVPRWTSLELEGVRVH